MRQFDIQISMGTCEKTFPVYYAVENHEEGCLQIFRCTVDLPTGQLPSWLTPGQFELVTHIREDVHMVDYTASLSTMPNTPQTDEFLYKVYAEIHFREFRRRGGQFPEC
jgi:hypothetical protein